MKHSDAWKILADDVGGNYIESKVLKIPQVELIYKCFKLHLDTYTVSTGQSTITYTRLRAIFINKPEFTFKAYKEGFFAKIGKALGMADIEIGDTLIDNKLIIKSNDESIAIQLLSKDEIKEKLLGVKNVNLNIPRKAYKNNSHMNIESTLTQTNTGIIKDIKMLKSWYYLFMVLIDGLIDLGITEDTEPDNCIYKEKSKDING